MLSFFARQKIIAHKGCLDKRGSSQSAQEHSLLLGKPPTINEKFWPTLNLVPKKSCWSYLSESCWHCKSKLYSLVVRWLFVSRDVIKMQFFGVVGFKSSTLTAYCTISWLVHQKLKTYSTLCVLYGLKSSIMISGTQIYFTLILASSHKSWRSVNVLEKVFT